MKTIILYTTTTCPHCKTAKDGLTKAGLAYVEKNASLDPQAQREMHLLGLMGVPAFNIDGTTFTGFDLDRIKSLLDYSVVACPQCSKRMRVPKGHAKIKVTCTSCSHTFTLQSRGNQEA